MNIIEAIKSGKKFRRKIWKTDWYAYLTIFNEIRINGYTNDRVIPNVDDIISEDWELEKALNTKKEEYKFDPTKAIQTKDGRKARILATDIKKNQPILAAVTSLYDISEIVYCYNEDGSYFENGIESSNDLINIPESKTIDIHVCGVYKDNDG